MIEYSQQQVPLNYSIKNYFAHEKLLQHKAILERQLPDKLKMAIAKQIENNLFSKASSIKN